jgi:hypothetical protein
MRALERLAARGAAIGARGARRLGRELAERARAELGQDARVDPEADGLSITGRGIRRRFALEPALRWLWRAR